MTDWSSWMSGNAVSPSLRSHYATTHSSRWSETVLLMGEFHTAFRASLQSLCCRFSYALQDPFTLAHFSNHFYSVKRAKKKKRLKGRMCETGRVSRRNCHLLLKSNLSTKKISAVLCLWSLSPLLITLLSFFPLLRFCANSKTSIISPETDGCNKWICE